MAFVMEMSNTGTSDDNNTDSTDRIKVDYDGMNQHIIDACKTQNKERILPAYISGYNDLGKQPRKNYETPYVATDVRQNEALNFKDAEGNDAPQAVLIKKDYYDSDAKTWLKDCKVFSKPQGPRQAITFTVTFPQIIVDIDPFFGKASNPRPLNLVMGGRYFGDRLGEDAKGKELLIQDPMFVQENTGNTSGTWGLGTTTTLHKMGNAADLLNKHGLMTKGQIGNLVGRAFQFKMRVHNKPNAKNPDKPWYTEVIKFVSELPEGLTAPELPEGSEHGFNLFPLINDKFQTGKQNDPATIEMLSAIILNTVRRAEDFAGSVLEKELKVRADTYKAKLAAEKAESEGSQPTQANVPVAKKDAAVEGVLLPREGSATETQDDDQWDDDIPF